MADEKNQSIGALWEKQSKKGTWFGGQIELKGVKIPIVVFKNDYKKEEKHPDWKIFISQPRNENNQEKSYPESGRVADVDKNNVGEDEIENLPF